MRPYRFTILFILFVSAFAFGETGCGRSAGTKTDDPEQVEQMRKQHEEMSQKELANE